MRARRRSRWLRSSLLAWLLLAGLAAGTGPAYSGDGDPPRGALPPAHQPATSGLVESTTNQFPCPPYCGAMPHNPVVSEQTTLIGGINDLLGPAFHKLPLSPLHSTAASNSEPVVHGPALSPLHDSALSDAHDPLWTSLHDPIESSQHDPGLSVVHDTIPSALHNILGSDIHAALPSSVHDPIGSTDHDVVLSEVHDATLSPAHNVIDSIAHAFFSSSVHDPLTSPAHDPLPSTFHDPFTSPAHDPLPSALHDPIPSSVDDPDHLAFVSGFHLSGLSPLHDPVPSSGHDAVSSATPTHFTFVSDVHIPGVSPIHSAADSAVHTPGDSANQGHIPFVSNVHIPPVSPLHDAAASAVAHTPADSAVHPAIVSSLHPAVISNFHNPLASSAHSPAASLLHPAAISSLHNALASAVHGPFASSFHDPIASIVHDPARSAVHAPVASAAHIPFISAIHTPLVSGIHDPAVSALHDPARSVIHLPAASATHAPVVSVVHAPFVSAAHDPGPSALHDPALSAAQMAVDSRASVKIDVFVDVTDPDESALPMDVTLIRDDEGSAAAVRASSPTGDVAVTLPLGAVPDTAAVRLLVTEVDAPKGAPGAVIVGGRAFNISVQNDQAEPVTEFDQDLAFEFQLDPSDFDPTGNFLGVYFFNEDSGAWEPVLNVVVDLEAGTATFSLSHITVFAVLEVPLITQVLGANWNVVIFTGATGAPPSDVAAAIGPELESVWRFDAVTQRWESFRVGLPLALNSLQSLRANDALFIRLTADSTGVAWITADIVAPPSGRRTLAILPGWNFLPFTGADATAIIGVLAADMDRAFIFDNALQRWLRFSLSAPAFVNGFNEVNRLDAIFFFSPSADPLPVSFPEP